DPLIRVAAAAATLRFDEENPLAEAVLDQRSRGQDEIGELARAALAYAHRHDTRRGEGEAGRRPGRRAESRPDAGLVHGTWARRRRWWHPDGSLHRFLRDARVFPKLYGDRDEFEWSGYFSFRNWATGARIDWNRVQAGSHLAWWAQRRLVAEPDLIGH